MPFGFLKSAVSSVSAFAGNAMASFVPKITSIVTPTIAIPSMSSLGANLVNQAKGMATTYAMGKISGFTNQITGSIGNMVQKGVQSVVGRIPSGYTRAIDAINILQEGGLKNVTGILGGAYNPEPNDHFSKQIKSLVSKSPYNFDALSERAHLGKDNNPFQYGHVHFPQEVTNLGDGHYIIFDILVRKNKTGNSGNNLNFINARSIKPGFPQAVVGEMRRRSKQTEGINDSSYGTTNTYEAYKTIPSQKILGDRKVQEMHSGKRSTGGQDARTISDSIVIGMPNQNHKFDYKVDYDGGDTGFTQAIVQLLENVAGGSSLMDEITKGGKEGLGRVKRSLAQTLLPSIAVLQTIGSGFVYNPRMETAFKSVEFRDFSFDFDLIPKNEEEKDNIDKMIKLFKFHMMPDTGGPNADQLIAPSEFQITYCYRENQNEYIPKISRCVLTGATFDYAPDNKFHTFYPDSKGAPPVRTSMSLNFKELEIMTKETVAQGF